MSVPPYTDLARVRALLSRDGGVDLGTAGSVDAATIELAINTAQNRINSRLGALYTVPFAPIVPELIQDIATALAAYDADLTFREVRDYASELNPVYLRMKDAVELLDQLQSGKAVLPDYVPPDPDPGPTDPAGGDIVDVINPNLCEFQHPRPSWTDTYYGWTL